MRSAVARIVTLVALAVGGLTVLTVSVSCRIYEPANKPLDGCRKSCEVNAKHQCTEAQCERGCEMILDRIVERESEKVIVCVGAGPRRCNDVVWADCASRVGVHADGGPPGPLPPPDDE